MCDTTEQLLVAGSGARLVKGEDELKSVPAHVLLIEDLLRTLNAGVHRPWVRVDGIDGADGDCAPNPVPQLSPEITA